MKIAELKTLAVTMMVTVIVSTSAFAAETTGSSSGTYDASAALINAAASAHSNPGPTGTEWSDVSMVTGQTLINSSEESLDAEMQTELYAEQLMAQQAAASAQAVTKVGTVVTEESTHYARGSHVGNFRLTGYYGAGTTYSGAYTQADHTIAADLSILPLGTKVFINNTVYTVEDIGSGVKGNLIDVYYNTYREAAGVTDRGWQYADVYLAVPV